ncbi:hypothetical protein [Caballeronia terrestris]|uniref:hypothetical protein n=1 Tax=Caballeronia terrestris TaxID=1226301 RepID=UPI000A6AB1F5|nr:hypothetical protein [Caballeronia terrestris]
MNAVLYRFTKNPARRVFFRPLEGHGAVSDDFRDSLRRLRGMSGGKAGRADAVAFGRALVVIRFEKSPVRYNGFGVVEKSGCADAVAFGRALVANSLREKPGSLQRLRYGGESRARGCRGH